MGLLVLVLAWALADVSKDLHTADYIVSVLGDKIPLEILPAVVFLSQLSQHLDLDQAGALWQF